MRVDPDASVGYARRAAPRHPIPQIVPHLTLPAAAALAAALLSPALAPVAARAALTFDLTEASANFDPEARAGFERAGQLWSNLFDDDITVRLDIGFSSLGGNTLGQASSVRNGYGLSTVQSALAADATSRDDFTAAASAAALGPTIEYRTGGRLVNGVRQPIFVDADDTADNNFLALNRANAKALGLLAPDAAGRDAAITFNSNFSFDFDPSDGVDDGKFDFVGIAAHEIGHALGFVSGNGAVNFNSPDALDAFAIVTALDLFRYSAESLAEAGSDGLDLSTDFEPQKPYFSIDGGLTGIAPFETGTNGGTGNQGSHWLDERKNNGVEIGIMDPIARPLGSVNEISATDVMAFDVIGYDLVAVPEPITLAGVAPLALLALRRHRGALGRA